MGVPGRPLPAVQVWPASVEYTTPPFSLSATATLGSLGSKTTPSLGLTDPAAGQTWVQVLPPSALRAMPPQVAANATFRLGLNEFELLLVAMDRITLQKSVFDCGAVSATGVQVVPPSLERNMPSPGWNSLNSSPVPASSVPLASRAIAPTASDPGNSPIAAQLLPPSLLCQRPPPAAPTIRCCAFAGSIQMALMRPPTLPGPISVQLITVGAVARVVAPPGSQARDCMAPCASICARARSAD